MLQIRMEQLDALTRAMHARFDYEAYAHIMRYFPDACNRADKLELMAQVRAGLRDARRYGFVSQYDLLRYLNLRFTFGPDFDVNPAHQSWVRPHLDPAAGCPTPRMDLLMASAYRLLYPAEELSEDEETADEVLQPGDLADPDSGLGEENAELLAEDEDSSAFDGLIWNQADDAHAPRVSQSIVPEYTPYVPPPKPGSVPASSVAPAEDDDGGAPPWIFPDEEEDDAQPLAAITGGIG